jgi:hypothetical protein
MPTPGFVSLDFSRNDLALEIAKQISKNLMEMIYKLVAKSMGEAVLQSGLVGRTDRQNLARLMRAGCLAAHKAILDEADLIGREHRATAPVIRQ